MLQGQSNKWPPPNKIRHSVTLFCRQKLVQQDLLHLIDPSKYSIKNTKLITNTEINDYKYRNEWLQIQKCVHG